MLRLFPLILIAVIVYNVLVFGGSAAGDHNLQPFLAHSMSIHLMSGDTWQLTIGDMLQLFTLALLFAEIVKATRSSSSEIVNHALSMVTFVVALLEFITLKGFGTSTFFFMMTMALFDVVAGYTISIVSAEHSMGVVRTRD